MTWTSESEQPLSVVGEKSYAAGVTGKVCTLWAGRLGLGEYFWCVGSIVFCDLTSEPATTYDWAEIRCGGMADCRFDALFGRGSGEIGRLTDGVRGIRKMARRSDQRQAIHFGVDITIKVGKENRP